MRIALSAAAALAALAVLAGCGSPPHYSMAKTRDCLKKAGIPVAAPRGDFVAETATDGAFRARVGAGNAVTISFGQDADDARNVSEGYVRFHARNVGISDVLAVDKNVVLLWKQHPSQAEIDEVTSCLK